MTFYEPTFWILALAAFLTSILSGVLGMGGGSTLLGVMGWALPSAAVVPLHAVVQLVSNFTRTLSLFNKVVWRLALPFMAGLPLGLLLAHFFIKTFALTQGSVYLRGLIGIVLLLFLALRKKTMKKRLKKLLQALHLPYWAFFPLGFVAGLIALFVGALGPFVSPFFLRDELSPEEIVATKAASVFISHLLKIPALLSLGFSFAPYAAPLGALCVCVVVGTLIGRKILAKVERDVFVRIFESMLLLLGTSLLARSLFAFFTS